MATNDGILAAMDTVVFERLDGPTFRVTSALPAAWAAAQPALAATEVDLVAAFPFLEGFLEDASTFWAQGGGRQLRSGPWTESFGDGAAAHFEAIALDVGDRDTLVIQRLGPEFDRLQDILQAARERRLAFEQAERMRARLAESEARLRDALGELARTNQELEHRVDERTEELRGANLELRKLVGELTAAEELERRRIAGCLHDRIGQSLAAAKIELGLLSTQLVGEPQRRRSGQVSALVDGVIADVRSLTFELGSPVLYELGLAAAVESLVRSLDAESGLRVACQSELGETRVPDVVAVTLYHATRELLHNVHKHAAASSVEVRLRESDGTVVLEVTDDGRGVEDRERVFRVRSDGGYGLFSIREQLQRLGGSVEFRSAPGEGTRVSIRASLRDPSAAADTRAATPARQERIDNP